MNTAIKEKILELEEKADSLEKNVGIFLNIIKPNHHFSKTNEIKGKFIECYDAVEELYNIKVALFGEESEEVLKKKRKSIALYIYVYNNIFFRCRRQARNSVSCAISYQ